VTWKPRGRLFGSELGIWWMSGGAYAFFPIVESDGTLRFVAGGRDKDGRSRLGVVTMEWGDQPRVTHVTPDPILDLGEPGAFDMDGVSYPCVMPSERGIFLYFTGWRRLGGRVPWTTDLGLAQSDDSGKTFRRLSRAPLMPPTDEEPIGVGSVCVVPSESAWSMFYTRLLSWDIEAQPARPNYNVWRASSSDCIMWRRDGVNVIPHEPGEYALGAPSFHRWDGQEQLYFTARGSRYRVFVAVRGEDGNFRRVPGPIQIESTDWDSEMQCYPHVREIRGRRYLFYCGNGYGRAGVGFAEWSGET
jgi:predicted GH43/DUF377 family glycosyl hydrolase